jgi:hypothetical protein
MNDEYTEINTFLHICDEVSFNARDSRFCIEIKAFLVTHTNYYFTPIRHSFSGQQTFLNIATTDKSWNFDISLIEMVSSTTRERRTA